MQQAVSFIQQVGFPIFVAVVLLYRVDVMHAENLKAIHALTQAINGLCLLVGHKSISLMEQKP